MRGFQMIRNDEVFMRAALAEAHLALQNGDVPVGAVIVKDGEIISRGHNVREKESDPAGHAEIRAIVEAGFVLGDWRLDGCTIYVTLEPCAMCSGACIVSRLTRIVFGAYDKKEGCCGSAADLTGLHLGNEPDVFGGILQDECESLLKSFFDSRREVHGRD